MFVLVVLALLGTAFSAVLDPSLTEWTLLKTDYEQVLFPLRDYILEVKTFRPDVYDTNPPYGTLIRTDKPTTMMALLYAGNWNNQVGLLVWNTIKYDEGRDIAINECDARYERYPSFPAGGEKEQIWAWNFFQDYVELTCNGELQYEQNFDEGEDTHKKPGLPEKCRALGDADVDRINFRYMAGEYIRGIPKVQPTTKKPTTEQSTTEQPTTEQPVQPTTKKPTTKKPTTEEQSTSEQSTTSSQDLGDFTTFETYPTCDCWTPECNYCSNLECTVKYDLIHSDLGIQVTSKLRWRKLNSIMFYDENGIAIGNFQWSLGRIYLTGCVSCQSPPAVRKIKPGTEALWIFSMDMEDGVLTLRIHMGGEVVYERRLKGECAERYETVDRFAFFDTTCENTFIYSKSVMVAGARITPDCAGACPQE